MFSKDRQWVSGKNNYKNDKESAVTIELKEILKIFATLHSEDR